MRRRAGLGLLAALGSVVVWASTYPLYKVAYRSIDPVAFMGVRYLIVAAVAGVVVARRRPMRHVHRRDRRLVLVAGLFGYGFLEFFFALGLERTTATASAVLIATHPIVAVGMLAFWQRRRPGRSEVVGLAVGFAGVVVFLGGVAVFVRAGAGDLLSLLTGVSFGVYGAIVARLGGRVRDADLLAITLLVGGVFGSVVAMPALLAQDWGAVRPVAWGVAAYACVFPVVVGVFLWGWALRVRGVARTAPIGFLEPLFAGALAAAFLGERPSLLNVAGASLVIAGVAVATFGGTRDELVAVAEPAPR
ncbi:MAG: DMT family transporter [Actinomycetota bacterium]